MPEDLILQTKLQPPQIKGKILRRERLLNLLKENLDKKLILICADAGYGKTTVFAQLCSEIGEPFMFYDLDASDNDIATFFNYLVTGIQQYYPDFGQRTKSVILQTRNIEILVGTFINEFVEHCSRKEIYEKVSLRVKGEAISSVYRKNGTATHPSGARNELSIPPLSKGGKGGFSVEKSSGVIYDAKNTTEKDFYIILDDYHHLQQNKEIGNAVDYLLRHLPANLHLIISSRSTPLLNLAYYFAKQELFRLEKEQLQFNLKEIQALLKEIYGLKVPDAELERIEKHSEGWITAIQLILQKISVAGEDKAKETLNGYIASGEEVFDYFAREIFETQPREIQEFLMRTSILGYMNPEVCNCLLNIKKSHNILSYLATEHIFTIRGKGDFKYHALFRDFLFNKLKATLKEKTFRLLCQKTGRCFSIVKDYTTAVDYYLLSEDFAEAAKCLERCCHLLSSSGKFDTFLTLLSRIPSTVLKEHPYLLLEKSRILSFLGKWEDALKELIITKKVFQRQRNKKGMAATLNQLGFTHLLLMRPRRALFFEKKAFKLTRNQKLKAQILSDTGKINRVLGKYKEAERYLKKALAISHKIDNTEVEMQILVGLAQVCSEKSDFNKAVELYSALLPKYGDKNRALSFVSVCANAASLYVELGNFNRAEELLTMAEELASTYNDWRTIVYASGIRGKLYLCQNNYGKAIEQYENTLELNKKLNERLVKIYARIDIAHAYLMMDDLIHARNEFKKIEALISSKIPPPILIDYLLIKGKLALLEKKSKKAENSLHRATEIAEKHQIFYQEMITLYHLSNFYLINGNEARMTCYLKRCLDIAKQNGYNFFLIRQGKIDLKILEYALAKKIETDYVLDILTEIESPEAEDLLEQKAERQIAYDLSVQLFGKLELKDKHNKVAEPVWRTRRMKSLFAYLIMNKGARVPADYLVEIFWSDRGRKDGMHSLHEHISYLRKVLGTILAAKTQSRSIIIYKDRSYFLNPEINLKVDVLRFEKLLAEAEKIKSTERAKCIQLYQKALDLFKGDFCPNIDDAWSDEKRMYYRSICGKITQEIGDYHYERKEFSNSLQYYSRALDFDPCDEKIHLTIMRLLSAAGDRTGVLKQYRRLEKVLSQELKTKPSPEAQRVYKEHLK